MGFIHTKPGLTSVLAPGRRFPLDALQEGLHILVGGRAGYVVASIGCSFSGIGFCFKTIIPDSEAHSFAFSAELPRAVLRWIKLILDIL